MTIKVMVVDDSAVVRQVLTKILNDSPDIEVYGVAPDPLFAQQKMQKQWPDVLVLDIEMPRMDGITFLRQIMAERPTPVVICSSLALEGTELTLSALAAGAVEIITKPQVGLKGFLEESTRAIQNTVKAAAKVRLKSLHANKPTEKPSEKTAPVSVPQQVRDLARMAHTTDRIVAIGTSTGGVQALESVLVNLPRTAPGVVIVQHMPEKFTAAFAKRLDAMCQVDVLEADSGERIIPGRVFIAPGGKHLEVQRSGAQYITRVFAGPAVNRHCPSVNVLFRSVAKHVGKNATGIIMTGMGDDGAQGLLAMRQAGARTYAQDEASCVVFGMPNEALRIGAASETLPLDKIASCIMG